MSSRRRSIQRDDFDIESRESYSAHRRSSEKKRSISRRRSNSRYRDHSRSRSRSVERGGSRSDRVDATYRRGRYTSNSRSRSRSRSHTLSERHHDVGRRHSSSYKNHRDTRSRTYSSSRSMSRSRSRSRSPAHHSRHNSSRRERDRVYNKKRGTSSKSRSRSRSSSHFRDYSQRYEELQKGDNRKGSALKAINEEDKVEISSDSYETMGKIENLEDLPLPDQERKQHIDESDESKPIYQFDDDEPIDRARIHREMEEKLRQTLAKEGKVYPPPKPEATHPVFANDGSFLELFKKMQQQKDNPMNSPAATTSAAAAAKATIVNPAVPILSATSVNPATAPYLVATATGKSAPPPPMVGRRKGGKILKTGVVAKPKAQAEVSNDPKDFWSLYLAEVNKYKNTACESEQGNRPLVK